MKPAACTAAVLALILAGATAAEAQRREYKGLDLLRLLAEKPWMSLGYNNRWDRAPRIDVELPTDRLDPILPHMTPNDEENINNYEDNDLRVASEKRSAVATALNSGRRRRQPTPALGVLNDVGSFFDSLRDNLEVLASLSPQQRSTFFQDTPSVVHAPSADRSWRQTVDILEPTTTTLACCGPALAGRHLYQPLRTITDATAATRFLKKLDSSDYDTHISAQNIRNSLKHPQVSGNPDMRKYVKNQYISVPDGILALRDCYL